VEATEEDHPGQSDQQGLKEGGADQEQEEKEACSDYDTEGQGDNRFALGR